MAAKKALVKNVRPYPVDIGGRVLAAGESAEVPVNAGPVAEGLDLGHLAHVNDQTADDTATDEADDQTADEDEES